MVVRNSVSGCIKGGNTGETMLSFAECLKFCLSRGGAYTAVESTLHVIFKPVYDGNQGLTTNASLSRQSSRNVGIEHSMPIITITVSKKPNDLGYSKRGTCKSWRRQISAEPSLAFSAIACIACTDSTADGSTTKLCTSRSASSSEPPVNTCRVQGPRPR